MKYICLDIETTGLNPETDQILEIGAIYTDTSRMPSNSDKAFHYYVKHKRISGDLHAISMNENILKKIVNNDIDNIISADDVTAMFSAYLDDLMTGGRFNIGGKNVQTFDLPFIKKLPYQHFIDGYFKRRCLDPGILFLKDEDTEIPNLQECLRRAGVKETVTHTALEDAIQTAKCIHLGLKR